VDPLTAQEIGMVQQSDAHPNDQVIVSNLLGEIASIQELLVVLENEPVSDDEAFRFVSGLQRDIVQLYRTVQA